MFSQFTIHPVNFKEHKKNVVQQLGHWNKWSLFNRNVTTNIYQLINELKKTTLIIVSFYKLIVLKGPTIPASYSGTQKWVGRSGLMQPQFISKGQ